ncbi:ATP-dependent DNA helicase Q4 [Podila humilis]|nr:ATP-dependent DNA helicase Q4 [Podila humilis]
MTGTATEGTKDSICAMLEIDRTTGVLSGAVIRDNLVMTVSLENDRESALLYLLQSPKFAKMDSILIYVMKQAQADALAAFLRVRSFSAESYHAGKSTQDRQRIQERFMNTKSNSSKGGIAPGGIRILCATIAFGLGLNKSNIRSVIHFSMPKSLENYIQEIGRSGRDGLPSNCHMFLNQTDYLSLRSLAYANGMDLGSLLRLIKKLFSRKSLVAHAGSISVKSAHPGSSKKRRAPKMEQKNKDEQVSSAENSDEEREPKKRRQNNNIAVAVRDSSSGSGLRHGADFGSLREQQLRGLVTSGESILVIPQGPVAMGQRSVSATETGIVATSKRLVVVREEIIEQEFDIKKEVLATLLSYIELDPSHPIKVIGSVSSKCTVKLLKSDEELFEIIRQAPLIDLVIKYGVLTGHSNSGNGQGGRKGGYGYKAKSRGGGIGGSTLSNAYCCDAMSLCQQHGITFTELVQELQLWKRKKWVVFELTDPGFCVEIVREPAACTVQQKTAASENRDTEEEDRHDMFVQQLGERLYRKLCAIERVGVAKVDHVYELFHKVATPTWQQQKAFTSPIVNERDKENSDANYGVQLRDEEILDSMMESEGDIVAVSQRQRPATALSSSTKVTEAELVLRSGIEEYFARRSGEGIGGVSAAEELFGEIPGSTDTQKTAAQSPTAMNDKMLHLYQYHNVLVAEMQSKWRSAVEVDLKVFLAQQYQQYEQQLQQSSSSAGRSFVPKPIDSPRVVSRIFHGIHSPCYPVMDWGRDKYWGKYVHFDFGTMMQMAGRILSEQRERRAAKSNVQ